MFISQFTRPTLGSEKDKGQRTRQSFEHVGSFKGQSSAEGEDFWMASLEAKANDLSTLEKMYPDASAESLARTIWAAQGIVSVDGTSKVTFWDSIIARQI